MNYWVLPPEITSMLMHSGPGSAPMLEAASAWDALASELDLAASSFSLLTSGLTGQAWQGPAAQAMTAAATPYAEWLAVAASHAENAGQQARTVASVFETAKASMVHPSAISANRNGLVQLVMSNLFGQNAPAIAAAESVYEMMWARDLEAMVGYHSGVSQAAAEVTGITAGKFNIGPGIARNLAQLFKRLPKAVNRLKKVEENFEGEIARRQNALGGSFIRDVQSIQDDIVKALAAAKAKELANNLNRIIPRGLPPLHAPGGGIGVIRF